MVLSFSKIGRIPFLNDSEHVLYFHNPKCSCRQVDNVFVAYHMWQPCSPTPFAWEWARLCERFTGRRYRTML